jgi:hypothetical protein
VSEVIDTPTLDDATVLGGALVDATVVDNPDGDAPVIDTPVVDELADTVVPETYELVAPDGVTLDAGMIEIATPIFKELGLTNEAAAKLMPVAGQFAEKVQQQTVDALVAQGEAQRKSWLDASKADAEIGGAKWKESGEFAAKALDALGFKEGHAFRTALNESGFGNHPDMIRAFAKFGRLVSEDNQFVTTDAGAKVTKTALERLYPAKTES